MLECYNEEYRDLLGKGPPAGKKHSVSLRQAASGAGTEHPTPLVLQPDGCAPALVWEHGASRHNQGQLGDSAMSAARTIE